MRFFYECTKHNCDYIGFEKFQQYVDMAYKNILFELASIESKINPRLSLA